MDIVAVFPDGSVMWEIDEADPTEVPESAATDSNGTNPSIPPSPASPPSSPPLDAPTVQYHYHYHMPSKNRWLPVAFVTGGAIAITLMMAWFQLSGIRIADPDQSQSTAFSQRHQL